MKQSLVDNRGPNTLARYWREHAAGASDIRIAVAYATESGVQLLERGLRACARNGSARLLISLNQSFTQPAALAALQSMAKDTSGRLQIRVTSARMHSKLYLARAPRTKIAVIGSSNLTVDGMSGREELNVGTRGSGNAIYDIAAGYFDSLWHDGVDLTRGRLAEYVDWCRGLAPDPRPTFRLKTARRSLETQPQQAKRYWAATLTGRVSDETQARVAERTDWDEKGWNWFGLANGRVGHLDEILVIDFTMGSRPLLYSYRVIARADVDTKDGRYFFAVRDLLSRRRILTSERRRELKSIGVRSGRDSGIQSLSPETMKMVRRMLRKTT